MTTKYSHTDVPNVVAPPPLIFFLTLILGLVVNWAIPLSFLPRNLQLSFGLPVIGIGVLLFVWSAQTIRRSETDIAFREPTKVIVSKGPYRFSRNPIYLSFTLVYLGIAISFNAILPLLLLPIVITIIQRGVIQREEQYLEGKFGEEYLRYKSKVRRWL